MESKLNTTFRWLTFTSILANVIFNLIYTTVTDSASIAQVTKSYPVYFSPAGYTFSIWGLIYIAFIVYGIVQVLPSQRNYPIYDTLSGAVILINIFCSAWIIFYTQNRLGVSVLILALALAVAFRAFRKAYIAVYYQEFNLWLQFPFTLLAGWLTVALTADFRIYLRHLGLDPGIGEGNFTMALIIVLTVLAFIISLRTYSLVYPAVISWALIGISTETQHEAAKISFLALSAAILLFAATFFTAVFRKIKLSRHVHQSRE